MIPLFRKWLLYSSGVEFWKFSFSLSRAPMKFSLGAFFMQKKLYFQFLRVFRWDPAFFLEILAMKWLYFGPNNIRIQKKKIWPVGPYEMSSGPQGQVHCLGSGFSGTSWGSKEKIMTKLENSDQDLDSGPKSGPKLAREPCLPVSQTARQSTSQAGPLFDWEKTPLQIELDPGLWTTTDLLMSTFVFDH